MSTPEKELLIAQSKVVLHMAERLVMFQVAFETYVHEQIGESGVEHDAHYARRREMLEQDFSGSTTALLKTLKEAIRRTETSGGNGAD